MLIVQAVHDIGMDSQQVLEDYLGNVWYFKYATYSTCTLTAGWNEEKSSVDYLLQEKSNFQRFFIELGADS